MTKTYELIDERTIMADVDEKHHMATVSIYILDDLVEAVNKTGHWIYDRTRDWDGECKYECSECGMGSDVDYAYCMRCGARMVESEE